MDAVGKRELARSVLSLIGSCVILFCTIGPAYSAQSSALKGKITDPAGYPLPGVRVLLRPQAEDGKILEVYSDASGEYWIEEAANGEYHLEASLDGFLTVEYRRMVIRYPKRWVLNIELPIDWATAIFEEAGPPSKEASVFGELIIRGERVSHGRVCLLQGARRICAQTNGVGQYAVDVPPGKYDVEVSSKGGEVLFRKQLDMTSPGVYENRIGTE